MLKFITLYRKHGVRLISQMTNPPVDDTIQLRLSVPSIHHYLDLDSEALSPRDDIGYLLAATGKTMVVNVTEMSNPIGKIRKVSKDVLGIISELRVQNTRFKYVPMSYSIRKLSPQIPVVYNYGMLHATYKYKTDPLHDYTSWTNNFTAVINNCLSALDVSSRMNFIPIELPKKVLSKDALKRHSAKVTKKTILEFDDVHNFTIRDLWLWINKETREDTLFSKIPVEKLKNVTLILSRGGKYVLLNMDTLYNFISDKEEGITGVSSKVVQNLFLSLTYNIGGVETVTGEYTSGVTIKESIKEAEDVVATVNETSRYSSNTGVVDLVDDPTKLVQEDVTSNPSDAVNVLIENMTTTNELTPNEIKKAKKVLKKQTELMSPYDNKVSLTDYSKVTESDLTIEDADITMADSKMVLDKTMLKSSLSTLDKKYIKNVLHKDISNVITSVNKSGIVIEDYSVESHKSIQGDYEIHKVKFTPIKGTTTTIPIRIPTIKEDGTFKLGKIEYRTRKQRKDVPIRKITYNRVGLTSYFGKVFVDRSPLKKYDYYYWLFKQLSKLNLQDGGDVKSLLPGDVSLKRSIDVPIAYTGLGRYLSTFTYKGIRLSFVYSKRHKLANEILLTSLEKDGSVLIGKKRDVYYILDKSNRVISVKDGVRSDLGTIADWIGVNVAKAPIEYSLLKIHNKYVPVVYVLSYLIGWSNLLKLKNVSYRVVEGNKRPVLEPYEYKVKFNDSTVIFDKRELENTILIAGLLEYKKDLVLVDFKDMDNLGILSNLFNKNGVSTYLIKEIELQDKYFVDPITKDLLIALKEPDTYRGLLLRASELLLTDHYPELQDTKYMLIKNYERVPGMLYSQLVKSVRDYNYRNLFGTAKFETDPYGVWKSMLEDSAKVMIQDHNPVAYLKEVEDVTYTGIGGRESISINVASKSYHRSDIGIFSEATKDTGDVGVTAYLSANPKITNLRGIMGEFDFEEDGATSILSTSGLLAPSTTNDDPKRANFTNIQNTHNIPIAGQEAPYVRTGYESVMAYRVGDRFVFVATDDGKVIKKDKKGIVVEYKDGTRKGGKLGTRLSRPDGGSAYVFSFYSPLEKGDTFKKDDIISYNTSYFESDIYDSRKLVYKQGTTIRTAIYETAQTYEDSSAISSSITPSLSSKTAMVKEYVVQFDNVVSDLVSVGDVVKFDTPLLYILDDVGNADGVFDKDSLKALKDISRIAPTAKYDGVIERVEMFYNGDIASMSKSIREYVTMYNDVLAEEGAIEDTGVTTGEVGMEFRTQGKALPLNTVIIRIFINTTTKMGIGDKGVFGNQLKSTIGEVYDYPIDTESGDQIDALFGYRSITARMVCSPFIVGTTITLLKKIAVNAVNLYNK